MFVHEQVTPEDQQKEEIIANKWQRPVLELCPLSNEDMQGAFGSPVRVMHRRYGNQSVQQWAIENEIGVVQRMIDERTVTADAKGANPRLNPFSTSLRPVIDASRRYRKRPEVDRLKDIVDAVALLPLGKTNKYAGALGNLQNEIDTVLDPWANGDLTTLLNNILRLSLNERRASRNNQLIRTQIQKRPGNEAVAIMGALLTGSLQYAQPLNGIDMFYNLFVRDKRDEELPENATLNCWEFVMYSAYLAGRLSGNQIFEFYKSENKMGTEASYGVLGWHEWLPTYDSDNQIPKVGDIMFVRELASLPRAKERFPNGKPPGHVVMYIGNGDVLSHDAGEGNLATRVTIAQQWPATHYSLQYTTPSWLA